MYHPQSQPDIHALAGLSDSPSQVCQIFRAIPLRVGEIVTIEGGIQKIRKYIYEFKSGLKRRSRYWMVVAQRQVRWESRLFPLTNLKV